MGKKNIGDVIAVKAMLCEGFVQRIISMQKIVSEEFRVLFIPQSGIHQNQPIIIFDQEASQGPGTEIIFIGRIQLVPDGFGNYAEHGAAIQLEISRVNAVQFHPAKILQPGVSFAR